MDEAGDMLTLPPGLADIAEDEEGGKAAAVLKKKEWERAEKWRKMAKVAKPGKDGEGMAFEFDTRNPKLIERTWKGIPDRWRAAAWHSFLSASAKKRKDSATEEQIIQAFHDLLQRSSADDLQIDIDVPRTINSHIMFRRRYRGGQRLLFRVLHSLSLYFPDTGYVQGMASLAATSNPKRARISGTRASLIPGLRTGPDGMAFCASGALRRRSSASFSRSAR